LNKKFSSLLTEVLDCKICESVLPLKPRPVLQIDPQALILVAGQAPGIRVHESGIPFNDPSGERLRSWMGIDRKTFYNPKKIAILPMGFCYPGTGRSGDLPPRPECAEKWRDRLLAQLPNIKLTLVIGQYAHAYHLKNNTKRTLTETVRNWKEYGPATLPMPHPSPRNNIWLKKNPWFEKEVVIILRKKVEKLLNSYPLRYAAGATT